MKARLFTLLSLTATLALLVPGVALPIMAAQPRQNAPAVPASEPLDTLSDAEITEISTLSVASAVQTPLFVYQPLDYQSFVPKVEQEGYRVARCFQVRECLDEVCILQSGFGFNLDHNLFYDEVHSFVADSLASVVDRNLYLA